ncbi:MULTISPECIES: hypothetical protein [Nocardia]|uniref:DUF8020 domain-containing protein n=1 Tax=Nocardia cerradoensis TaxID=85688 RepID=A0A231HCH5_9NOCA|nr:MULTISPECIES: hypothetical protein [Nocardia]NKY47227.1 hypothetical protein [Nocardia cerradoensis]OXR46601.1 hypothetical protein B7C42_01572 [Nocardia cerradoensis]
MMMRKFVATAAMLVAAVGVAAGTATADPAAPAAPESVYYKAEVVDNDKAVIKTDGGSIVNEDGMLKIKAANGTVLAGTPLNFRVDDFEFPIAADISGNTATLTPQFDEQHAVYKPVALPFEESAPWKTPYDREVAAFTRLKDTISTGATIGTLVGGIGGAAIGCIAGAALGVVATGALATLFGLGPLGGCIAGAAAVGFLGVLAGQIFVTAPVAIGAAIQYWATTTAPFNPPAPAK